MQNLPAEMAHYGTTNELIVFTISQEYFAEALQDWFDNPGLRPAKHQYPYKLTIKPELAQRPFFSKLTSLNKAVVYSTYREVLLKISTHFGWNGEYENTPNWPSLTLDQM